MGIEIANLASEVGGGRWEEGGRLRIGDVLVDSLPVILGFLKHFLILEFSGG